MTESLFSLVLLLELVDFFFFHSNCAANLF
jgi:hypothetical protein